MLGEYLKVSHDSFIHIILQLNAMHRTQWTKRR